MALESPKHFQNQKVAFLIVNFICKFEAFALTFIQKDITICKIFCTTDPYTCISSFLASSQDLKTLFRGFLPRKPLFVPLFHMEFEHQILGMDLLKDLVVKGLVCYAIYNNCVKHNMLLQLQELCQHRH